MNPVSLRPRVPWLALLLTTAALAGCVATNEDANAPGAPPASVTVVDAAGHAVPFALVTTSDGSGLLRAFNADKDGRFDVATMVPPGTTTVTVAAQGLGSLTLPFAALVPTLRLESPTMGGDQDVLLFRSPVALECPAPDAFDRACGRFGEPVVEVAGDGTIWASATCCVGKTPPIWTSRDAGATFQLLPPEETGTARETTGVEGDFAIDDAGNVYFFDMLPLLPTVPTMGTPNQYEAWFTSYAADGTHRWTTTWPLEPTVDRPWVRAGAADEVFILYNTGQQTNLYTSTDGGRTWQSLPAFTAPCPLGTFGQGPDRHTLFVTACPGAPYEDPQFWMSTDAGLSFAAPELIPLPKGDFEDRGLFFYLPPVADEGGTVYVVYEHFVSPKSCQPGAAPCQLGLFLARRSPDGAWSGPFPVGPGGQNFRPWPAAGKAGHFGVAWYHTDATNRTDNPETDLKGAEWHLYAAASVDADAPVPHFQFTRVEPRVLATGPIGRQLGDFLQSDVTPDGRLVIVYGQRVEAGATPAHVDNYFASSEGGLGLQPLVFLNGPRAA